jgi:hypothetical protein
VDEQLEYVFYKSQNLERSWRGRRQCRSTSVGDVVRVQGVYWIVAPVGYHYGWKDESQ